MMICLIHGYINSNKDVKPGEDKQFDFNLVGNQYARWYSSDPFDIGQATETSIKTLCFEGRTAKDAIEKARTFNSGTKSNGSLMRCMPHAIFAANLEKINKFTELKRLVAAEASFVHANAIVHEANFVYVTAIAHLLNNATDPNRMQEAFDIAMKLSRESLANTIDPRYGESVNLWLQEAHRLATQAKSAYEN